MAHAIIEEIGHILPPSGNLAETLGRAADYASHQGHAEVTLEHLLLALTEDPDASLVMSMSRVEIDQLKGDVSTHLGRLENGAGALSISAEVRHVLEAAAAAARGRRGEIDGAIVLAAIVGDGRSTAAHMLRAHGLTFEDAIRALQQAAQAREAAGPAEPPRATVQTQRPAPAPPQPTPAPAQSATAPESYRGPASAEEILATARQRVQGRSAPGLPEFKSAMTGDNAAPPPGPGSMPKPHMPQPVSAREIQRAEAAADAEFDRIAEEISRSQDEGHRHEAAEIEEQPSHASPPQPAREPPMREEGQANAGPQPAPPAKRPLPPGAIRPNVNAPAPPQAAPPSEQSGLEAAAAAAAARHHSGAPAAGPVPPAPVAPGPAHSAPYPPAEAWPSPPSPAVPGMANPQAVPYGSGAPPPVLPGGMRPAPASAPLPGFPPRREAGDMFGTKPAPHATNAVRPPQQPPPHAPMPSGMPPRAGAGLPPPPAGIPAGMRSPPAAPPAPAPQAPVPQRRAEPPLSAARGRAGEVSLGQMVENIPRSMRVGIPVVVEARIARADVKALAEGLQGGGAAWRHELAVTKAMSVRLRSPDGGFFIETSSPETQWIENTLGLITDDYASWRWTVTPRERGARRLQLIISARTVGSDGLTAETALPDQVVNVKVRVNFAQTARRAGGWVLAAIAGGVLARFGEDLPAALAKLIGTLVK